MAPALRNPAGTGETREPAAPAKSQEAPVKSQAAPAKSQAARIKSQEVPAKSQAARIKSQEVPAKKSAGPAIRRKVPEEGHPSEGSGLSQPPFWRPQSSLVFLPADSCLFHPAAEDQGPQKQSRQRKDPAAKAQTLRQQETCRGRKQTLRRILLHRQMTGRRTGMPDKMFYPVRTRTEQTIP